MGAATLNNRLFSEQVHRRRADGKGGPGFAVAMLS
jgi:hypothetical protein